MRHPYKQTAICAAKAAVIVLAACAVTTAITRACAQPVYRVGNTYTDDPTSGGAPVTLVVNVVQGYRAPYVPQPVAAAQPVAVALTPVQQQVVMVNVTTVSAPAARSFQGHALPLYGGVNHAHRPHHPR